MSKNLDLLRCARPFVFVMGAILEVCIFKIHLDYYNLIHNSKLWYFYSIFPQWSLQCHIVFIYQFCQKIFAPLCDMIPTSLLSYLCLSKASFHYACLEILYYPLKLHSKIILLGMLFVYFKMNLRIILCSLSRKRYFLQYK